MDHHTQYGECCSLKLEARAVRITVPEEMYLGEKAYDKRQRHNNINNNKLSWLIYNHTQQQKSLLNTLQLHKSASDKLPVFILNKLQLENVQPYYVCFHNTV